jgi:hypothetical protein
VDAETAATCRVEPLDWGTTPIIALLLASLCRFRRHFDQIYDPTT